MIVRIVTHPKLSDAPLAYDQSDEYRELQALRVVEVVEGEFDYDTFNMRTYGPLPYVLFDHPHSYELRWRPKYCMYEVVRRWHSKADDDAALDEEDVDYIFR